MSRKHPIGVDIKDPGAWGTALAVCKPHEQIMNSCLQRELKAKTKAHQKKKENAKTKKKWCKTGDDSAYPIIKKEFDALIAQYKVYKAKIKELLEKNKRLYAEYQEEKATIKSRAQTIRNDKATMKADDYNRKWIHSGRIRRHNENIRETKSKGREINELSKEIKELRAKKKNLYKRFDPVGRAMNERDCAKAMALLGK